MRKSRYLIVNADDFGQGRGINRGIIEAHERGVVTSASLMVRWPAAAEAAQYARVHPQLSVGLHLDLGEWIYRNNEWEPLYEVISADDRGQVVNEINDQLETFRSLMGREPTHIDSHQHVHLREPARSVVIEVANELGVPLRSCNTEISYVGGFYGQTAEGVSLPDIISVSGLFNILRELPEGVSELGCHPGFADRLDTMYKSEREQEIKVLCDVRIKETIDAMRIELCSFANLPVRV
jgi:chitin disaccharide deacetylase